MKKILALLVFVFSLITVSAQDGNVLTVTNMAQLRTVSPFQKHSVIQVAGYYLPGDGGGGIFFRTNTVASTNLGTRIASATSGWSWQRVYDGPLNLKWFGAKGDGTTDDAGFLRNAINSTPTNGILNIPAGTYKIQYTTDFGSYFIPITNSLTFLGEPGAILQASTTTGGASPVLFRQSTDNTKIYFKDLTVIGPTTTNNVEYRFFSQIASNDVVVSFEKVTAYGNWDCFLKTEPAANFNEVEVIFKDCNITCGHNLNHGLPNLLIQDRATLRLLNSKFYNTTEPNAALVGYHVYSYLNVNLDIDSCHFGETKGWAIASHGGSSSDRKFAIIRNSTFEGTRTSVLGGTYSDIEVPAVSSVMQVDNCFFGGNGKAFYVSGDLLVNNCFITSTNTTGGAAVVVATDGTKARFTNTRFVDSLVSIERTSNAAQSDWLFDGCHFISGISGVEALRLNQPVCRAIIRNSVFSGSGSTAGMIRGLRGDLDVANNVFYNTSTVEAIGVENGGANVLNLFAVENFYNNTNAIKFEGGITLGTNTFIPRRGVSQTTVSSASTLTLDLNYDTFLVSGTTPIQTIQINDASLHAKGNIGPIKLIPTGAWSLTTGGNVLGNRGTRTINRAVTLQSVKDISTSWLEVTSENFSNVWVNGNIKITSDYANILELKNGATAQRMDVFGNFISASDYSSMIIAGNYTGGQPGIAASGTGSTPNLDLYFESAGTGKIKLRSASDYWGAATFTNKLNLTPSAIQSLSAGTAIIANAATLEVVGSGGAVTLTGTPTIADGSDGQIIEINGTDATNTVTLQDESGLVGSNLELGAASRVLGAFSVIRLRYRATDSKWREVSFIAN